MRGYEWCTNADYPGHWKMIVSTLNASLGLGPFGGEDPPPALSFLSFLRHSLGLRGPFLGSSSSLSTKSSCDGRRFAMA